MSVVISAEFNTGYRLAKLGQITPPPTARIAILKSSRLSLLSVLHMLSHVILTLVPKGEVLVLLSFCNWENRLKEVVDSVASNSLQPPGLWPSRLFCPWDFSGKNTGVGCHFLLWGIIMTQESNLCLLHLLYWQADSLPLAPPQRGWGWVSFFTVTC